MTKPNNKTQRIVFFGSPEFAIPSLQALIDSGRNLVHVYTQANKPKGRGKKIQGTAVANYCEEKNMACTAVKKIKTLDFYQELKQHAADLFVVVAFGRIFTTQHLQSAPLVLNVHGSLLPQYRGAAPMQYSLLNGDQSSGISIMRLVEELDAGDVLLQKECAIGINEHFNEFALNMADLGAASLIEALDKLESGSGTFKAQDHALASFSPPIKTEQAQIHWASETAITVHNKIRAFQAWPGAFCTDPLNNRIKILQSSCERLESFEAFSKCLKQHSNAQNNISFSDIESSLPAGFLLYNKSSLWLKCKDQLLQIKDLQIQGKKALNAKEFLAGYRNTMQKHDIKTWANIHS